MTPPHTYWCHASCLLGIYFQLVSVTIVYLTSHRHTKRMPSLAASACTHGIVWEGCVQSHSSPLMSCPTHARCQQLWGGNRLQHAAARGACSGTVSIRSVESHTCLSSFVYSDVSVYVCVTCQLPPTLSNIYTHECSAQRCTVLARAEEPNLVQRVSLHAEKRCSGIYTYWTVFAI